MCQPSSGKRFFVFANEHHRETYVERGSGETPNDYNDRATWDEILGPHGWTKARRLGQGWGWRRPDKTDPGISATTGQRDDADRKLFARACARLQKRVLPVARRDRKSVV